MDLTCFLTWTLSIVGSVPAIAKGQDDSGATGDCDRRRIRDGTTTAEELSGTGLMKINDEEEQVSPGDTVIILPGMRHKITNNGTVPLVLLACCSPEWTAEDQVLAE